MTWYVALLGSLGLLLLLLTIGVPIFAAFLILNVSALFILFGTSGFGMLANSIYSTATMSSLSAVPLFILMGELLFRSGAMGLLLNSMDRLIGRFRGRQYILCIILSALLGALSGAATAVAGMLGRGLLPTMRQRGYDLRLSTGTILAGASLDPIIPPSVLAILIATMAQISTGGLLIAGIGPGLMLTGMFIVYVLVRLRMKPELAPEVADDIATKTGSVWMALLKMLPSLFIFFLVMGLVMLGIATPTEAAATGVAGAAMLAAAYGNLSVKMLKDALFVSVTVASLLLIVMCSAAMFSQLLTLTGAARELATLVTHSQMAPSTMLLLMLVLPFVLFMFLDPIAIMMILIPIYQPIIGVFQFDEIWFWTLFLVCATVGGISPPFGYTLFALHSAAPDIPMTEMFKAAWPFVWIIVLSMILMVIFPPIVTWLPNVQAP